MNATYVPKVRDVVTCDGKLGQFTVQTIDQENQTAMLGRVSEYVVGPSA